MTIKESYFGHYTDAEFEYSFGWARYVLALRVKGLANSKSVSADHSQSIIAQDPDDKKIEIRLDTQNVELQNGVVTSGKATDFEMIIHGKQAFTLTGLNIDLSGFNLETTTQFGQLYTELYDKMHGALVAKGDKYDNDFEVGGGAGKATVDAGDGNDVIYIWHQKNAVIDGGKGSDLIDFDSQYGSVSSVGGTTTIDLVKGTGTNPFGGTLTIKNVESLEAASGAVDFRGDGHENVLIGSRNADILMGRGGDDTIKIQLTTTADPRATHADGGDGMDTLWAPLSDIASTQTGSGETISYHNRLDLEHAHQDTGTFNGGKYTHFEVYQAVADWTLSAFDFFGSSKGETAIGSLGHDTLNGRDGNDVLDGFSGADELTGGLGADHFLYHSSSDSTVDASGQDMIEDFKHSEHDKIDLSQMIPRLNFDNVYDFIGSKAFDGKSSEVRFDHDGDGNTIVQVNDTADTTADMQITLIGNLHLVKGDFML